MRSSVIPTGLLALLIGGAALMAPSTSVASTGVGVSPARLEASATPGGSASQEIRVEITGDQTGDYIAEAVSLPGASDAHSAAGWMSIEPSTLTLAPGEQQTATVSFEVPDGLPSGGYYAGVAVRTVSGPVEDADQIGVQFGAQAIVQFLFTIEGEGPLITDANFVRVDPVLELDGRIGFAALLHNTGNVYVAAEGSMDIAPVDGDKFAALEFPRAGLIMPEEERVLTAQGSVPLEEGKEYTAAATLQFHKDEPAVSQEITFRVELPVLSVTGMDVCENLERGPTLSFAIQNDGALAVRPGVAVSVREAGGRTIGEHEVGSALLWSNDLTEFQLDFAERLTTGEYVFVVLVTAQIGTGQPTAQEFPFQIGGVGGEPAPLCADR